jgi:hypothetical protein
VNVLVVVISILPGALLLALATMTILSNVHNKAVVEAINRYRASGRIIAGGPGPDGAPQRRADSEEGDSLR